VANGRAFSRRSRTYRKRPQGEYFVITIPDGESCSLCDALGIPHLDSLTVDTSSHPSRGRGRPEQATPSCSSELRSERTCKQYP
jgi:hypothetical protein